jgi:Cof subfamily protein (haloacid dehalogenase superfamily)
MRSFGLTARHRPGAARAPPPRRAAAAAASAAAAAPPPRIRLIVSDVDGTLVNSAQELTPRVEAALRAAAAAGVPTVLATGKALGPWLAELLPRLPTPRQPGVFLQGLLVTDAAGAPVLARRLEPGVVREAAAFAAARALTLVAYSDYGRRILCAAADAHTDRLLFYKEPPPEAVGDLAGQAGNVIIHKLIFMASPEALAAARTDVELTFGWRCALTSALPGMLELLPAGNSKGSGVEWLLKREFPDIDLSEVMAIGDGDNDVELLRMCGLGVVMGNASAAARAAADAATGGHDADGAAEAIERHVLAPRGLALAESFLA